MRELHSLEIWADINLLCIFNIINYWLYHLIWESVSGLNYPIPQGLYISANHALVISCYFFYRCILHLLYTDPGFNDLIHLWILSWTLTYSFFDLEAPLQKGNFQIVFHHLLMMISILICISLFLTGNDQYNWIMNLGFLSEMSTPLLDNLKIRHYTNDPAPKWMYIAFAVLFFFCRPVVFSYMIWTIYQGVEGIWDLNAIGLMCMCVLFLLLNLYWFCLICGKFLMST